MSDETGEEPLATNGAKVVTVLVGLLLAGFVVLLATRSDDNIGEASSPLLGKVVPELSGLTLDGTTFDIDDTRGSWVLLNFFGSWCIPCIAEHPELVDFAARHDDGSAQVVSVTMDDSEEGARAFFDERGGTWPVIIDAVSAPVSFVVLQVPESFLINPSGVVVGKWNGQLTADEVDDVITKFTASP